MNENQEKFLNEFHNLLHKYNINEIYISYHSGDKRDHRIMLCPNYRITLGSNGQKLEFIGYSNNCFVDVSTYDGDYKAGDGE